MDIKLCAAVLAIGTAAIWQPWDNWKLPTCNSLVMGEMAKAEVVKQLRNLKSARFENVAYENGLVFGTVFAENGFGGTSAAAFSTQVRCEDNNYVVGNTEIVNL